MNSFVITIALAALAIAAYYVFTIVRGLTGLRPQIQRAALRARQNKQVLHLDGHDFDSLLFKAQRGDSAAQWRVGLMFSTGDSLPHDDTKAFMWFEKAALAGFIDAQYCLGLAYERGRGVPHDAVKARFWYEQAANSGNAAAQCNLGVLYLQGHGIDEDWITAACWFLKAASQNNSEAAFNLEWILQHVSLLPKSTKDRFLQYRQLADSGDIDADFLMAWCFEHGVGVRADLSEASRRYSRATNNGHLYAQDSVTRLKALQKENPAS